MRDAAGDNGKRVWNMCLLAALLTVSLLTSTGKNRYINTDHRPRWDGRLSWFGRVLM